MNRWLDRIGTALGVACAVALAACSTTTSGGGAAGCVPGATNLCWCGPGAQGVQVCNANGGGFSQCVCSLASDAAGKADGAATADGPQADQAAANANDAADAVGPAEIAAETGGSPEAVEDAIDWSELLDPEDTGSDMGPVDVPLKGDGVDGDCPERAKIVYVVTKNGQLLSFTPDKLKFALVGMLNCGVAGTPFSMGIDREANAWVIYQSMFGQGGPLFKVSTLDAKCQATNFVSGTGGFELFGMGFSADNPAAVTEKLFIGGGDAMAMAIGQCKIGTLDLKTMQVQNIGALPPAAGCPDLTGNGNAEVFGFFPQVNPAVVAQLDKTTGKFLKNWPLPANAFNGVQAWAFAQWGGKFWLFFRGGADFTSAVWALDPTTGNATKVLNNTGYVIVGAGVSSCAPTGSK